MARSFAGGTDRIQYAGGGWNHATGCFAFWMKTTQVTANAAVVSVWTASSRTGFGFIINNTLNKLLVQCYGASGTPAISMTGTTTINDGNWHHVALNWNIANGALNSCYVDGVLDSSANAAAAWSIASSSVPPTFGDNIDAFWPSHIGHVAEAAAWFDRALTADEILALSKGFSPEKIYPLNGTSGLVFYAPMIREAGSLTDSALTVIGTTVSDHPRVIGL